MARKESIRNKIEEVIAAPWSRGIMPVHLNGYMADMVRVMELAGKYGLVVVEDTCQSLGGQMLGKKAGSWGLTG